MAELQAILWVSLGSALGGGGRYWVSGVVAQRLGETFPWGTFTVNVVGSTLIGLLATLTAPEGRYLLAPAWREFLMLGVLGGFTTFSSFSLQSLQLAQDGEWLRAAAYVVGSVCACLAGVWLGAVAGMIVNR